MLFNARGRGGAIEAQRKRGKSHCEAQGLQLLDWLLVPAPQPWGALGQLCSQPTPPPNPRLPLP